MLQVACTNWKRLMMILSGKTNKTDPLEIKSWVPHEVGALKILSDRRRRVSYNKYCNTCALITTLLLEVKTFVLLVNNNPSYNTVRVSKFFLCFE